MSDKIFKSGFIGLIGRTNVGKSTLINKILNKNVVITSEKAQTTRNRINCILNTDNAQAIFVDCPGFFKPRNLLGEKLNNIIYGVLNDADIIVAMIDLADGIGTGDYYVFDKIKNRSQPRFLLLNKIDLIKGKEKKGIEQKVNNLQKEFGFFDCVIPISAKNGNNVDAFLTILMEKLQEGPKFFPDGIVTDLPLSKMIAEIIREKLTNNLFEELPYSINVEVENMTQKTSKSGEPLISIECCIYTEKKSQKAIIIGKSGEMLKKIGILAREELEKLLDSKVYLQIWVKVMENWTKNDSYLNRFGY